MEALSRRRVFLFSKAFQLVLAVFFVVSVFMLDQGLNEAGCRFMVNYSGGVVK